MKRKASWLSVLLLTIVLGEVSAPAVDLTARPPPTRMTSSSFTSPRQECPSGPPGAYSGTVDPATGGFTLYLLGTYCPYSFRAQAGADGSTFTGYVYTAGPTPGDRTRVDEVLVPWTKSRHASNIFQE